MSESQIIIRPMMQEDFDAVLRIFGQGISSGLSTFRDAVPSTEEFDAGHLPFCRLVVCGDGSVAGWCALSPVSARACYKGVAELSIYIDEAFRGRGLGTALLTDLCREAKAAGIWSLLSVVFAENEASLRLQRKCGFREIGYRERIAQDIFGEWQNTIMFEKRF